MTLSAVDAAANPTPKALRDSGCACVIQYIVGYAMPANYPAACANVGLPLVSACERANDAALGGTPQGATDAAVAVGAARHYGQPKGTAIYAAIDFEPVGTQMGAVVAYATAWALGVRAAGYLAGIYGGLGTVQAVRATVDRLWQTLAWSTGVIAAGVAIYQSAVNVEAGGVNCDTDEILATPGAWNLDGPVYLFGTPPTEDTVAGIAVGHAPGSKTEKAQYLISATGKLHLSADALAMYQKKPFTYKHITPAPSITTIDSLPLIG